MQVTSKVDLSVSLLHLIIDRSFENREIGEAEGFGMNASSYKAG